MRDAHQIAQFLRNHLGPMPAQPADTYFDVQQVILLADLHAVRRQKLQGEQVEYPAQGIRLGFGLQAIAHVAVATAGGPDIGSGQGAFEWVHAGLRKGGRNSGRLIPVFFRYDLMN
ncbi:hypothetical protein PpSQ1_04035 [Pseudomonas putida]|nr:hypothetical protein PpSQ1_04035 [Pseudomonas putida]